MDRMADRQRQMLVIVKTISHQLMELEKRLESLEVHVKAKANNALFNLVVDDGEDDDESTTTESSEGYQSAPPTFSYAN